MGSIIHLNEGKVKKELGELARSKIRDMTSE